MSPGSLHAAVFLISAVGIAYQVGLMRVLSVGQWHHFAYMIISVAMLGFAASGTVLALLRSRIAGREATLFRAGALLLVPALAGCYAASQSIAFETFELASRPAEFWDLFALYLVLSVPFFLVSWCVALGFLLEPRHVGRVYFWNMLGSGVGAAAVVGLLAVLPPGRVAGVVAVPAGLAVLLASPAPGRRRLAWVAALAAAGLLAWPLARTPIRISEYKGLSYALDLPDARVVAEEESPLSVLTAVSSEQIRETPGQLSAYPWAELGPLPEQVGLYFDAGAVSPVHRFDGDLSGFAWLDYVTPALPYRLVEAPRVAVIGAGGGTEVLNALVHGAREVTAVEVDPEVFPLVRGRLGTFSGGLYGRADVRPVVAEGRGFLQSREAEYDVIQIALLDSFNASAAGVHALSESYLYTVEAVALYLERLSPDGVLSVTRWLKTPPRDAIKMFGTLVEALERSGVEDPGRHLAFVRSWNTGTLVASRRPLSAGRVDAVRRFAAERWFDLAWLPGMEASEANRYTILERPAYYEAARAILSPRREAFYDAHPFHLRPATDSRPYFHRFFRWKTLPELVARSGTRWLGTVEWGYLALVATVVQAALAGGALVLLPLWLFGRGRGGRASGGTGPGAPGDAGSEAAGVRAGAGDGGEGAGAAAGGAPGRRGATVAYFGALGIAFMFLEIAFIQKFMLFLSYPIYAVAVVLAAFLVFSGLGSYYADRRSDRPLPAVRRAVAGIAAAAVLYLAALPAVFDAGAGWPDGARILASGLLLAPLAFGMGIPFPAGLQLVSDRRPALVPWAWGVNGAASVLGATLATLTAVHLGFGAVVALAVAAYAGAAALLPRLAR